MTAFDLSMSFLGPVKRKDVSDMDVHLALGIKINKLCQSLLAALAVKLPDAELPGEIARQHRHDSASVADKIDGHTQDVVPSGRMQRSIHAAWGGSAHALCQPITVADRNGAQ